MPGPVRIAALDRAGRLAERSGTHGLDDPSASHGYLSWERKEESAPLCGVDVVMFPVEALVRHDGHALL